MPSLPIKDEAIARTIEERPNHTTNQQCGDALGISEKTVRRHMALAAERGLLGTLPVLAGFRLTKTTAVLDGDGNLQREFIQQKPEAGEVFEVPDGHSIKGISALVDPAGRIMQQWVKTKNEYSAEDVAERLKDAFADYEPAADPVPPPVNVSMDLLTLIPANDWHVGMFAWSQETDANWDLKIASRVIGRGIEDAIARSPASSVAIVLGGGDLTHADNNKNQTARSGNVLDVDGRHSKVVETAGFLMARTIDAALRNNEHVIVRILKGNHDEETAPSMAWFLYAWYRNEPRVTVDTDKSLFFYHQHGNVMLAATHGHEAKLKDMPQIMAHRRPAMWGSTRYRYAHGFHVHHQSKYATEGGGVISESHQAPIPQDAWHYGAGFLSGRSVQTITYHREYGEVSRVRVAMLDAANDNEPVAVAA